MTGLEHHRRSTNAACLEIDDPAYCERIVVLVVRESLRAEQTGFLPVGQQEDDRLRRRLPPQVIRHFQPDGEANAIVAKPGAGVDAVIVRRENKGGAFRWACREEDVLHEGATCRRSRH